MQFNYVSASVGGGKTTAARAYMSKQQQTRQGMCIYAGPTLKLLEEVHSDFSGDPRLTHLITSESEGYASHKALEVLNKETTPEGTVVFITTKNLGNILSKLQHPERITLFMDEVLDVVSIEEVPLSDNRARSEGILGDLYLEPTDAHDPLKATPLCQSYATKSLHNVPVEYRGAHDLMKVIVDPQVDVFRIPGSVSRGPRKEKVYWVTFVIARKPQSFEGLHKVVFMSAEFHRTIFAAVWGHSYGVTFRKSGIPEFNMMQNTHRKRRDENGNAKERITVHWMLPDEQNTSGYNWERHQDTLLPNKEQYHNGKPWPFDQHLITQYIREVEAYWWEHTYALQVNNVYQQFAGAGADVIPVKAEGLNTYREYTRAALLASTNPSPALEKWLKTATGRTGEDVKDMYRFRTIYQGLGRISVRNYDNEGAVEVIVGCRADAESLLAVYKDAKLGRCIGSIKSMPRVAPGRKADTSDKARKISKLKAQRREATRSLKSATTDRGRRNNQAKLDTINKQLNELENA